MQLRHVEIADDTVIQNVDFQALFESIESDTENYDEYRDEAIRIGNNLSLLYQVDNGEAVALGPKAQQAMDVVLALKALTIPIVHPYSDDPEDLKKAIAGHKERAEFFIEQLESEHWKINFGDHSNYVHWMIAHAYEDSLYCIEHFGCHLSAFSCQTSEHFNKVLKRCVERLHGFSTRCIGENEWRNKFGFVMHEYMLRLFYFYDTICPLRHQTCTKCHKSGHNKRTCAQV